MVCATAAAALVLSPQANATPDQDRKLHDIMAAVGIELYPAGYTQAYQVCSEVWSGRHPEYVASMMASGNPDWYFEQAETYVAAAITIYCPPEQLARQLYT